jgi:DNA-binding SARP family transcriptional activator
MVSKERGSSYEERPRKRRDLKNVELNATLAGRFASEPHSGDAVRLALLDAFELTYRGQPLHLPVPAQRLLAFLALQEHPVVRVYAAGCLWLDSSEERAFGSLRSALWRVNRLGYGLVDTTRNQLRLDPQVTVDFWDVIARARAHLDGSAGLETANRDRAWLSEDLLVDWYDDWVLLERERFRQLRVHALELLCERLTAARRYGEAVDAGLEAIKGEPFRESAHRALMKVHIAQGNGAEAIREYHAFRALLNDQLNLEPSSQMAELVGELTQ